MGGLPIVPLAALGVLFFATPIIVLVLVLTVLSLRGRIHRLEARLADFERRAQAPDRGTSAPAATGATPESPWPSSPVSDAPQTEVGFDASTTRAAAAASALSAAPPGPTPVAEATSGAPRGRSDASAPQGVGQWEGRLGGTWLSRVGALLFVVGVGFFLKHAFEQEWIGPVGRVLIGLAAGVAMVAGGIRLAGSATYRVPAQSLVAVGIGVLYLSLYAAHASYALVGASGAFVALAIVTAGGFVTALRLNSRALAVLATLGGLLAPVILDTDTDAPAQLFGYLAILDVGVLAVASRRRWLGLPVLAFAGTQLLYWGWLDRPAPSGQLLTALGWATAFFLAFAAWALAGPPSERPGGTTRFGRALLIFAVPVVYFAVARRVLDDPSGHWLAALALMLAAAYFVAARVAAGQAGDGPRIALFHHAVALAFLVVAPAVTFGRQDLVIVWSVEGLVLLLGGFGLRAPRLRLGGLAVSALAWGRLFAALGEDAGRAGTFLLAHPAFPATVAVVVTAAVGALVYRARENGEPPVGPRERLARPILVLVAVGSAALLLTTEFGQFRTLVIPPPYVPVVKSVVWMLAAMLLLALARGDATRILFGVSTVLLLALVVDTLGGTDRWARIQTSLRPVVANPRFLAGCLLVVLAWLWGEVGSGLPYLADRPRRRLAQAGSLAAALLLLWNLSAEVGLAPLPETGFDPDKLRSAALSVLWALYAFAAMAWGLWRGQASLRLGAILLFSVTVLKVLLVDLSGLDALYRILSVLMVGAALLVASFLYARSRRPGATG